MAIEISMTDARAQLADLANRVAYGGEQVVLTRHGRPFVALISAEDLTRLGESRPLTSATSSTVTSSPDQSYPTSIAATYTPPAGIH